MKIETLIRRTHTLYTGFHTNSVIAAVSHRSFFEESADREMRCLRKRFLVELGFSDRGIAAAEQVHSSRVQVVNEPESVGETDGLVTDTPGLFLSVVTADCLPVFLWTTDGAVVGILHAGWRGTAAGIVRNAVQAIRREYAVRPQDAAALLGPCISPPFYEVGSEVARRFPSACLQPSRDGRFLLDLKRANRIQLQTAGVPREAIFSDDRCTFENSGVFFSYRSEGPRAGRMIAVIGKI
jgi:hypothetical protein